MPATVIRGRQILDGSIQRADLDVTTGGQAVVTKIVQGGNVALSSTGADSGTGDVTIAAKPSGVNTQVQFNDAGAFGGDANLTYDKASATLRFDKMTTPNTSVIIKSTGGTYGPASLEIGNNPTKNGAVFSTFGGSVDLVDFVLQSPGGQANIRYERRSGSLYQPSNTWEMQLGDPTDASIAAGNNFVLSRKPLLLNGDPSVALGAATKQYVDAKAGVSSDAGNAAKLGSDSKVYVSNTIPIAFVFSGVPKANAMLNVPVTINLAIAASLTGSAYYNATDPVSTAPVFTLTVQPAGTTIGTINKPTGTGAATFSGSGSSTLAPGNTLRITATTVDATFADVGITILATRR
jgi:hypothetical protein